MSSLAAWTRTVGWLIHKDLLREFRGRLAWPAMLLLGVVLVLTLAIQLDLSPLYKQRLVGGLFWVAVFFAGSTALDRSFAAERDAGCWDALRLYPHSPAALFLAKLAVNFVALACLEGVLLPLLAVLSGVSMWSQPGAMAVTAALGNLGFGAAGVLLSGLVNGIGQRNNLLILLLLPLAIPVVLGASEATRLAMVGSLSDQWWQWIQLLGAFAVLYITVGLLMFELVIEE